MIWLILRDLGAEVSFVGVLIVAPVVLVLLASADIYCRMGACEKDCSAIGFGLLHVPKEIALAALIVFGLEKSG